MSKFLFEIEAVGSPGWIEYGTATPMDFCGRRLFSESGFIQVSVGLGLTDFGIPIGEEDVRLSNLSRRW
jgi:hypothetical protein